MGLTIEIRPAIISDAQAIAEVHINTWRSTYSKILDQQFLNNLSVVDFKKRRKLTIHNPDIHTMVADSGSGNILGFAVCGFERTNDLIYKGEISALYVLPEYQRDGIGRRLFSKCVDYLLRDKFRAMKIWVLEKNSYQQFYLKHGGQIIDKKRVELGGSKYVQLAYGWTDLIRLKEQLSRFQ